MHAAVAVKQLEASAAKPLRSERFRILEMLDEPASAANVARRLDLPRQTVNYHVRRMEQQGLVEVVEVRQKGNCIERVMQAAPTQGSREAKTRSRFSNSALISAASRAAREVSSILQQEGGKARKKIPTLTLDTSLRLESARARLHFSEELVSAVEELVLKYDSGGRGCASFRLFLCTYPEIQGTERKQIRLSRRG